MQLTLLLLRLLATVTLGTGIFLQAGSSWLEHETVFSVGTHLKRIQNFTEKGSSIWPSARSSCTSNGKILQKFEILPRRDCAIKGGSGGSDGALPDLSIQLPSGDYGDPRKKVVMFSPSSLAYGSWFGVVLLAVQVRVPDGSRVAWEVLGAVVLRCCVHTCSTAMCVHLTAKWWWFLQSQLSMICRSHFTCDVFFLRNKHMLSSSSTRLKLRI